MINNLKIAKNPLKIKDQKVHQICQIYVEEQGRNITLKIINIQKVILGEMNQMIIVKINLFQIIKILLRNSRCNIVSNKILKHMST